MSVTVAIVLLACTVVIFRALYLGARMSRRPWWAADGWINYLFGPCLLTMLTLGVGSLIEAGLNWSDQRFTTMHAVASALIVVAAIAVWRLLTHWNRTSTARSTSDPTRTAPLASPVGGDGSSVHRGDSTHPIAPTPRKAA